MRRALLITVMLIGAAGIATSSQTVYPKLTRETLVGTWEAICGIGASPFVFHIVIAPSDSDFYLSEIYLESMKGRLFRMEPCTVADGNVTLHFRSNDVSAIGSRAMGTVTRSCATLGPDVFTSSFNHSGILL